MDEFFYGRILNVRVHLNLPLILVLRFILVVNVLDIRQSRNCYTLFPLSRLVCFSIIFRSSDGVEKRRSRAEGSLSSVEAGIFRPQDSVPVPRRLQLPHKIAFHTGGK